MTAMTANGSSPRGRRSTSELLAAVLDDHDAVAFGELMGQYRKFLRAEARRHVPPGPRAPAGDSDLVQDALMAACQNFSSFRGRTEAELLAWLRTILYREARKLAGAISGADPDPDAAGAAICPDWPDPRQVPPDETIAEQERAAIVRGAISNLPAIHQSALDLRFHHGLSLVEIGRQLGRSADAVRKLLARAFDAVRRRVGAAEAEDG
jgi:RNA polymerase sigma-70 factor (ECF subfamily)